MPRTTQVVDPSGWLVTVQVGVDVIVYPMVVTHPRYITADLSISYVPGYDMCSAHIPEDSAAGL